MSKPDDIPQDVWDEARRAIRAPIADEAGNSLRYFLSLDFEQKGLVVLSRAIMAAKAEEREACAGLAEDVPIDKRSWLTTPDQREDAARIDIAAAIRQRGTP